MNAHGLRSEGLGEVRMYAANPVEVNTAFLPILYSLAGFVSSVASSFSSSSLCSTR